MKFSSTLFIAATTALALSGNASAMPFDSTGFFNPSEVVQVHWDNGGCECRPTTSWNRRSHHYSSSYGYYPSSYRSYDEPRYTSRSYRRGYYDDYGQRSSYRYSDPASSYRYSEPRSSYRYGDQGSP